MWAALFPGQGSQHVGMGKDLFENFKTAQLLFEEASDTLSVNFKTLCFEGPESDLALTENTQPALLLVSTICARVLKQNTDVRWQYTAGHSVGEYAAVVDAGVLSFADALLAVKERGKAMQSAVPVGEGAMLAVMGLSNEQVEQLCRWAVDHSGLAPMEPANFNSPGQVVISGSAKLATWVRENATSEVCNEIFNEPIKRMKLIPLKVSAPFHCSMMKPAEEKMAVILGGMEFRDAEIPIVQNVPALAISKAEEIRQNLVQQVTAPVKWTQCVHQLVEKGVQNVIELGAGKVLSGLVKKIDNERLTTFNMQNHEDIKSFEKSLEKN